MESGRNIRTIHERIAHKDTVTKMLCEHMLIRASLERAPSC